MNKVIKLFGHRQNAEYEHLYLGIECIPESLLVTFEFRTQEKDDLVFSSSWVTVEGMTYFLEDLQESLKDPDNTQSRFDIIGYDWIKHISARMTCVMTKPKLSNTLNTLYGYINALEKVRLRRVLEEIS